MVHRVDPIARFMQEHDETLLNLAALNKAAAFVAAHGATREGLKRIQDALGFLEDEVLIHNRHEEEALFPVLERYVEGPTDVMRAEHRELKRELRKLKTRINRPGRSTRAAQEIADQSRHVVQLFVNHIHKENHILFPLVRKFLTRDALREIARRITEPSLA